MRPPSALQRSTDTQQSLIWLGRKYRTCTYDSPFLRGWDEARPEQERSFPGREGSRPWLWTRIADRMVLRCMALPFADRSGGIVRRPGWIPFGKLGVGPALAAATRPKIMRLLVNGRLYKIDHLQGQDSRMPSRRRGLPSASYAGSCAPRPVRLALLSRRTGAGWSLSSPLR